MANGKFSNPRGSNQEEWEIEAAFRQALGESLPEDAEPDFAGPMSDESFPGDDALFAEVMLDELLMEDELPEEIVMEELFPDRVYTPSNEKEEPLPETTRAIARNKAISRLSIIVAALAVVVGLVLAGVFLLGSNLGDDGRIFKNVTVAGVNLGGMTPQEAEAAIHAATDLTYTKNNMVVNLPEATLTFTPRQTGATLDVAAAVQAAYDYGRTGNFIERRAAKATIQDQQYHIGLLPYLSLNVDFIRQELDEYSAAFNSSYKDSRYEVTGEMPALEGPQFSLDNPCQILIVNAGSPGRHLDMESVYIQILDAYSFNIFEVSVAHDGPVEYPQPLDLQAIWNELYIEPENFTMDMETFEILPGVYGYGFDIALAEELLAEAPLGTDVYVPMEYVIPEDNEESLKSILFRDTLSYAETPHTNNENRNNNLALACKSINGIVLMPGEEFSYNEALGKRTPEAGYKAAAAYADGQTVLEYGGGICQVSSTLYYATLLADMEIVVRSAHSYASSYIDLGMDATVSWGGPEFKFANNSNYPIRIEAEVSDGYVKVWIIGTDDKDYYVDMEYEIIGVRSYETIYEDYPEDNEKGYVDGEIIQTPYTGYTVKTYRCKYSKETGELLSRDLEATSRYNNRDLIIARVGAEETEDPSEGTDNPTDPTEPTPTDPAPTDPAPTDPLPTDPAPTDPAPTDPAPTEPAPTDPAPADPPVEPPEA